MVKDVLASLESRGRWGLGLAALAIIVCTTVAGFWLLSGHDEVLFADLKPQDAAQMTAELDRQKIAYSIAADGTTLLVDASVVHSTRLKLLGKDMPLHGAIGFELFNNGDFGMTEFAQKVNYQRALQGEITRTILSLSEVKEARVHLALPEEGLFKRTGAKPKAAITLGLKAGASLRPDQVQGIQRLVAGAVPGIGPQDVTLVDLQGVALTRSVLTDEAATDTGAGRLDLKRETEKLLARKATEVLEKSFGVGEATAVVDVTLNMDQVRVTTEDVIGTPRQGGASHAGVVVRERENLRDVGAPSAGQDGARAGNSQREVEYQVGRRVEQVVTQPGAVRRIHLAAVVRQSLDEEQLAQARALLAAAVGGVTERGDLIVIHSLRPAGAPAGTPPTDAALNAATARTTAITAAPESTAGDKLVVQAAVVAAALLIVLGGITWLLRLRRVRGNQALTDAQRQALLLQLTKWIEAGPAAQRIATASTGGQV